MSTDLRVSVAPDMFEVKYRNDLLNLEDSYTM